jgi:hypothetical protein
LFGIDFGTDIVKPFLGLGYSLGRRWGQEEMRKKTRPGTTERKKGIVDRTFLLGYKKDGALGFPFCL